MFTKISRPKIDEEEEDLLRLQADFHRTEKKPSAKVVRVSDIPSDKIKKEREAAEQLLQKEKALAEAEAEVDKHDTHITKVLGDIVKEKDLSKVKMFSPYHFPNKRTTAFPQAMKRQIIPDPGSKKSIFAQEMERKKKQVESKIEPPSDFGENLVVKEKNFKSETSSKQQGDFQGNYAEIMEEIRSKFTPEQIDFLRKRGKAKAERNKELNEEKVKSGSSKPLAEENFLKDLVTLSKQELVSATNLLKITRQDSSLPPETVQEIEGIKENNYPNMGKLEEDKLEWIKNVETSSDIHEKLFHRFDFSGKLLSLEESKSLSSKLGMHHHGVQPDLAGYTLQDLFGWTRSQSQSQRNVALSTLSKIIEKDRRQEYEVGEEISFVQSLLNAGFLFVLRLALDEKADVIVKTAVTCLKNLICPLPFEEKMEKEKFLFCDGCEMEPLQMTRSGELWKNDKTDHHVASKDLIHGLIKMNVIARLRFLLEFANLELTTILECLLIIERFCQHSLKAAVVVFENSHLMELFSKKLAKLADVPLPSPSSSSNNNDDQLAILASTFAVFRRILQAGRHVCKRVLLGLPSLVDLAFRVLAIATTGEASRSLMPILERVKIEASKLLTVAVSYGYLTEEIREKRRSFLDEVFERLHDRLLERATELLESDVFFVRFFLRAIGSSFERSIMNVGCSMVGTLIIGRTETTCLEKKLLSVLMDFLPISSLCTDAAGDGDAAEIDHTTVVGEEKGWAAAKLMKNEKFITSKLLPLISSLAAATTKCSSSLLLGGVGVPTYKCSRVDCMSDIAALNHIPVDAAVRRELIECAVNCNLLVSLLAHLSSLIRCCRNTAVEVSGWFGTAFLPSVKWMEMDLIKMPSLLYSPVSRLLLSTLDLGMKIISLGKTAVADDNSHLLHAIALLLSTSLRHGQENSLFQLLTSKLFHPDLMRYCSSPGKSPPPQQLDNQRLRSTYLPLLQPTRANLNNSRSRSIGDGVSIDTFHVHSSTLTLLPVDWPFVPILDVYNSVTIAQSKPEETSSLRNLLSSLRLIEFLEKERSFYMGKMRTSVKITRLMCIFLAGDDLYADKEIRPLLRSLCSIYCQNGASQLDFFSPIAGITSFYDFYESLLEHYEAVSMRDKLFSAVVLLPLLQSCQNNRKSKLSFWCGHKSALSMHSVTEDELLLPMEYYVQPYEDDGELLQAYLDVLLDGTVNPTRSPALYKIATSHVGHFINTETSDAGRKMRALVIQHANDRLKTDVFLTVS